MLIARYNFPMAPNVANANFIASTAIGGNKVFSLNGNNGLVAFTLVPKVKIESSSPKLVLSWEKLAGFTLQASPSLSPPFLELFVAWCGCLRLRQGFRGPLTGAR